MTLTVTGIELRPGDLEEQPAAQAGTIEEFNQAHIAFSPAFWPALEDQEIALYGIGTGVDLTGAPGARAGFASAARKLGLTVEDDSPVDDRDALERSTRIEAIALYVLAGIVAVAGAVLLGSALRRDVGLDPLDRATLRALGVRRAEMAQADVLRAAPILLVGGAVALLVALRRFAPPRVRHVGAGRSRPGDPLLGRDRGAGGHRGAPGRRRGPVRRRAARLVEGQPGRPHRSRRGGAAGWWSGSPRSALRPGR